MPGGRPPLEMGTYGDISASLQPDGRWKARARFRDATGRLRYVSRFADTKGKAVNSLRAALRDWQDEGGKGITRKTMLNDLAADWLAEVQESSRAANTKEHYRYVVGRYITPYLGHVRIGEADTGVCDAALTRIGNDAGKSAAKAARAVLNGMFKLAMRHGTLTANPVREVREISIAKKSSRALTVKEATRIKAALAVDPRAVDLDLSDLVAFGLATGCRIGEALAIRDTVLDLKAGTVEINATAIRISKAEAARQGFEYSGLVIQERPKTAAGWRVLALPPRTVAMLRARAKRLQLNPPDVLVLGEDGGLRREEVRLVFPAPLARTVRDPSNTAGELRAALDRIDRPEAGAPPFEWVSFHTFRKTVATRLDEAGRSAREVADQLGHSQMSMTQDVYMGRRVVLADAAKILG